MTNILSLSDSLTDIKNFVKDANLYFFQIEQLDPDEHSFDNFRDIYFKLRKSVDLSTIDLIIAEYVEAIPLVYFMRKDGFFCPSIFIPHTNAYPLNILFYFLLVSHFSHPNDVILCGSMQAAKGYTQLLGIRALPLCTFGIRNSYQPGDKFLARTKLGLPQEDKLLLYTGRFMNDKGLVQLLDVYERVRERIGNVSLILSVNHIDPVYYNQLAPRLRNSILFYRLRPDEIELLYQSADLFVSTAISIFETYGKSPLEAISSGVPAILPRWDGFQYYITPENGSLANVIYTGHVEEAPYSFAIADVDDFVEKCCKWLQKDTISVTITLPDWAYYDHTMATLSKIACDLASPTKLFYQKTGISQNLNFFKYPAIIKKICSYYDIQSSDDVEIKAERLGLINRENPGDLELLHELHDVLFKGMNATADHVEQAVAFI